MQNGKEEKKDKEDVGLVGPDPGLALSSQTNPYTTGPFSINPRVQTKVSPEAVWGDVETKFPHS